MISLRASGMDDGMTPEMHFSMSTDCLQAVVEVQEKSFVVMDAWLGYPEEKLLLSIVTKGLFFVCFFL